MSSNPFNENLDRNAANYQPLTPLNFLERAAAVFPNHVAIIHGTQRRTYAEFYARARRLASALAAKGIGVGDTVTAMLPNIPAMLEAHYGVPMLGAVLHSLNTRLDAAVIAFQLDHAESKVVICDPFSAINLPTNLAFSILVTLAAEIDFSTDPTAKRVFPPLSSTNCA
jgi:fatty-acyl-CoA synthase